MIRLGSGQRRGLCGGHLAGGGEAPHPCGKLKSFAVHEGLCMLLVRSDAVFPLAVSTCPRTISRAAASERRQRQQQRGGSSGGGAMLGLVGRRCCQPADTVQNATLYTDRYKARRSNAAALMC